jgi:hypothetical protein
MRQRKTTTATALCEKLRASGGSVDCYHEGDTSSPIDLFGAAYLTTAEFTKSFISAAF